MPRLVLKCMRYAIKQAMSLPSTPVWYTSGNACYSIADGLTHVLTRGLATLSAKLGAC